MGDKFRDKISEIRRGTMHRNDTGGLHCEDGPAIILDSGRKDWYVNGGRHRNDGPAVELAEGSTVRYQWWWANRPESFDDWCIKAGVSDEQKLLLKLQYG